MAHGMVGASTAGGMGTWNLTGVFIASSWTSVIGVAESNDG
jgi:hypothetical protein